MPNIIVMGAGRSGTSMVAGSVAASGDLWLGKRPLRSRSANPLGFYEDRTVNWINEELLHASDAQFPEGFNLLNALRRRRFLGWLAILEEMKEIVSTPRLRSHMSEFVGVQPVCLKDPRFMYTHQAWRNLLDSTRLVVTIRHPFAVVASTLNEVRNARYLRGYHIDVEWIARVWLAMHKRMLPDLDQTNRVVVDFDRFVSSEDSRRALADFTEMEVDTDFPTTGLIRSANKLPDDLAPGRADEMIDLYQNIRSRSI